MKKSKTRAGGPPRVAGDLPEDVDARIDIVVEEIDDEDEDDGIVIGEIEDTDSRHRAQQSSLKVFDFETLAEIHRAHDKVASVLKEGSSSLPRAFTINVARDRQNVVDSIAGGVFGLAGWLIMGDPLAAISAAPVGFTIRNVWNTLRIRGRRDKLRSSDPKELESTRIPELKNAWDLTCWKFVRLVKGYNARVHAVNRIRENRRHEGGQDMMRIANDWDRILREVYVRLQDVCSELQRHQSLLYSKLTKDLEELDDNLRSSDLLGYFDGVPILEWLDIKEDRIMIRQAAKIYRRDLDAREELREMAEHRKESYRDVDDYLRETEPIFDELEREHGKAVDAILEDADDGEDDA